MATVKDITTMCKLGNVLGAYNAAKADFDLSPQDIWAHREMGWALYYMLKIDIEHKNHSDFLNHFEELSGLDLLTVKDDSLIFNNVLWKLGEFIKEISENLLGEMDRLFSLLNKYTFAPSNGYSYLLKSCFHLKQWEHLVDFIEWWNLDNLLPEDFQPFKLENGKKILSLAEQAYLAYSKALLRKNDKDRILVFLPKIEKLMDNYPDMIYLGYYCGKLMLAIGTFTEDALHIIMPFVRKKQSEFWIWQLLSEIYYKDSDICLACLLRAVHSKTQEIFLGKVRIKLVNVYLSRHDYARAKYHIDIIIKSYVQQGWHLPYEVQNWLRESWVQNTEGDDSDSVDYKRITNEILLYGTNESVAVVTYVDLLNKRAILVYGEKKCVSVKLQKLNCKVFVGCLLKIHWLSIQKDKINIVDSDFLNLKDFVNTTYIKQMRGTILRPKGNSFAFIEGNGVKYFIPPMIVKKCILKGGETATAIVVYNFNKKRDEWVWSCVSVKCNK